MQCRRAYLTDDVSALGSDCLSVAARDASSISVNTAGFAISVSDSSETPHPTPERARSDAYSFSRQILPLARSPLDMGRVVQGGMDLRVHTCDGNSVLLELSVVHVDRAASPVCYDMLSPLPRFLRSESRGISARDLERERSVEIFREGTDSVRPTEVGETRGRCALEMRAVREMRSPESRGGCALEMRGGCAPITFVMRERCALASRGPIVVGNFCCCSVITVNTLNTVQLLTLHSSSFQAVDNR